MAKNGMTSSWSEVKKIMPMLSDMLDETGGRNPKIKRLAKCLDSWLRDQDPPMIWDYVKVEKSCRWLRAMISTLMCFKREPTKSFPRSYDCLKALVNKIHIDKGSKGSDRNSKKRRKSWEHESESREEASESDESGSVDDESGSEETDDENDDLCEPPCAKPGCDDDDDDDDDFEEFQKKLFAPNPEKSPPPKIVTTTPTRSSGFMIFDMMRKSTSKAKPIEDAEPEPVKADEFDSLLQKYSIKGVYAPLPKECTKNTEKKGGTSHCQLSPKETIDKKDKDA